MLKSLARYLGYEHERVSAAEKLASVAGGVLSIYLISLISFQVTGASGAALIVPSMGASAVLLFAVPHGRLSQPWSLFGGHLISALIGVACYRLVPDTYLAAALAVGLAIGAMHLASCIHPPGGATALAAVIGGPAIHDLGFGYVVSPILLNSLVIFVVAIGFNALFPWRRYPASAMRFTAAPPLTASKPSATRVDLAHIEQAMQDMDLIVDLTTEDLQQIFDLSLQHASRPKLPGAQIRLGHYYTNGLHGKDWSVRQIIDEHASTDPAKDMVIYRVVEGQGIRSADSCTREEFAQWAARELFPTNIQ